MQAIRAQAGLDLKIVPVSIRYSHPYLVSAIVYL